ncbi:MAG: hypothetical protein ACK501_09165 [Planctomycetota bacterium]
MLAPTTRRRLGAALPLLAVWLLAAWPVVLYLVHCSDPVAAVQLAQFAARWLFRLALGSALLLGTACLLYPPLPAWLRLAGHDTWRRLGTGEAPLRRALADLAHFESAQRHLEVARLSWQRGRAEVAAVHARRAIELDPQIASAWHLYGLALFAQNAFDGAAQSFAHAEQLDPGHAFGDALLLQGRSRFLLGEPRGLELLRQHERQHGGGARSHVWLAEALLRAGEREAAVAALRIAAQKPTRRTTAEEGLFRARARVRLWRRGGGS